MSTPTLRERKKNRTRQALIEASVELFERQGFEATTLEQICERVEISIRTFFRYFESKQDLAFSIDLRPSERIRQGLEGLEPHEVLSELRHIYNDFCESAEKDPQILRRLRLMAREPVLGPKMLQGDLLTERRIAAALAGGSPDSSLPAQLIASMIVGGTRAAAAKWIETPQLSLQALAGDVFTLVDQAADVLLLPLGGPAAGRAPDVHEASPTQHAALNDAVATVRTPDVSHSSPVRQAVSEDK